MAILTTIWRRNGDRFEQLLTPHIEHLYRLAYRFTGSRPDAEDLVQDLLVQLYPRRQEIAGIERLRPWLARSLYNRFIDSVRRRQRDPLSEGDPLDMLSDDDADPERDAERWWMQKRLAFALRTLSVDQRALVGLHDIEGYTLAELVEVLDVPLGTLKSRLHRARQALRQRLGLVDWQSTVTVKEPL